MRSLLAALDSWKKDKGDFPSSLRELQVNDPLLKTIDVSIYRYEPAGFQVGNNQSVLLSVGDPMNKGNVLVGSLGGAVESVAESRLMVLDTHSTKISKGMTKSEVKAVLGEPDNKDNEIVWMWGETPGGQTNTWLDMSFEDGLFLVFQNGKVVTPLLKNTESNPWESLSSFTGITKEEAEKILGPRPKIVTP